MPKLSDQCNSFSVFAFLSLFLFFWGGGYLTEENPNISSELRTASYEKRTPFFVFFLIFTAEPIIIIIKATSSILRVSTNSKIHSVEFKIINIRWNIKWKLGDLRFSKLRKLLKLSMFEKKNLCFCDTKRNVIVSNIWQLRENSDGQ